MSRTALARAGDLQGKNTGRYQASRPPGAQGLPAAGLGLLGARRGQRLTSAWWGGVPLRKAHHLSDRLGARPWGGEPLGHCPSGALLSWDVLETSHFLSLDHTLE